MRSISIIIVVALSFSIFSCSDLPLAEYLNNFGYDTRYTGLTNQAAYNGYDASETMAEKLVEAIETAIKLYQSSITALIPAIYVDNSTDYIYEDNGTCLQNWGYRSYNSKPLSQISLATGDNYTFTSYINYYNYCRYDTMSTSYRQVLVDYENEASKQEITAIYYGNYSVYYELEAKDISISIKETTGTERMTIYGLVIKEAVYTQDNFTASDPDATKEITLRLDMPGDETNYRFDFYSDNSTLYFYHYDYGYVVVDVSDFMNYVGGEIPEKSKIVMYYQDDKKCQFSKSEFGTSDFNCDYEYDSQETPIS